MAAHVDFVEDDGYTAQHADAFKHAGGKYGVAYTDPAYAAHCPPPFAPPGAARAAARSRTSCRATSPRTFHDADGARVHRFVNDYFQYQEVFNVRLAVGAARVRADDRLDPRRVAAARRLRSRRLGQQLTVAGGVLGSLLYYSFSAAGVEIADDAPWIAGESAMLAAAGKPLMINGGDPATWGPAYGGAFLDLPSCDARSSSKAASTTPATTCTPTREQVRSASRTGCWR